MFKINFKWVILNFKSDEGLKFYQGSRCKSPLSPNGDYLLKTAIILLIWRRKMAIILFSNWINEKNMRALWRLHFESLSE